MHDYRFKNGLPLDAPVQQRIQTNDLAKRLRAYAPAGKPDECWKWTRAISASGYGVMAVAKSKNRPAHVVAWELANGQEVPAGMVVRHTCDTL